MCIPSDLLSPTLAVLEFSAGLFYFSQVLISSYSSLAVAAVCFEYKTKLHFLHHPILIHTASKLSFIPRQRISSEDRRHRLQRKPTIGKSWEKVMELFYPIKTLKSHMTWRSIPIWKTKQSKARRHNKGQEKKKKKNVWLFKTTQRVDKN